MADLSQPGAPAASSQSPGWRRISGAIGCVVLLTGTLSYIGLVDPHNRHSVYPLCPFKLLTGWNCPACGGLRMVHDLLHGDLAAAVSDNVVLLIGIPMLVGWVLLRRHLGRPLLSRSGIVAIVAVVTAWTVLRNLPGFPLVPLLLSG